MNLMDKVNKAQCKSSVPSFNIGDSVKVYTKIKEGDNERIQVFSGVVIARKGSGINECFTVRRIAFGQGMERIFPVNSPRVEKIEIERHGRARRSKLYYLRKKIGKTARVKEDRPAAAAPVSVPESSPQPK